MSGMIKIWWHDGVTKDVRANTIPIMNEPELGFELVPVSRTANSTRPAPTGTAMAVVETDVNVRYFVRRPGNNASANQVTSKPLAVTGLVPEVIGIAPGCSISFIEI